MKTTALTVLLTLLLLLVVWAQLTQLCSANFFPDPGPDLPRIYIRSNGAVEPNTAPITSAGNTYKLTGDIILQTIVIQRDNITLDGSGYLIEGNKKWVGRDSGNNGVIITKQNNINVTNLNIEKFTVGIRISGSSHINIVGNRFNEVTAVFSTPIGLVINDSFYSLIENNTFSNINGPAISCNGTNNTIRGNSLTHIMDSINGSISLQGSLNQIIDNKIETATPSIRLGLADSNIITRNNATGAISLVSSSNNKIFENNLTGLRLIFSSNNTIFGNHLTNSLAYNTIELDQGTIDNTFFANTFPINCSVRYHEAGPTFWDNGTIGNYWSDYNGKDKDGNGIGDSPYIITGVMWDTDVQGDVNVPAGQDNCPLMEPYDTKYDSVLPMNAPFPSMFVTVGIIVVIVGAGLIVIYYRRRQRDKVII